MKCANCVRMGYNEDGFPCCLADPRWPAPCEYEDDGEEDEDDWSMVEYSDEPSVPEGEFRIGKECENDER